MFFCFGGPEESNNEPTSSPEIALVLSCFDEVDRDGVVELPWGDSTTYGRVPIPIATLSPIRSRKCQPVASEYVIATAETDEVGSVEMKQLLDALNLKYESDLKTAISKSEKIFVHSKPCYTDNDMINLMFVTCVIMIVVMKLVSSCLLFSSLSISASAPPEIVNGFACVHSFIKDTFSITDIDLEHLIQVI
jgi:hypothetical protein